MTAYKVDTGGYSNTAPYQRHGYRITLELLYAKSINDIHDGKYSAIIDKALDAVYQDFEATDAVSQETVAIAEDILSPMQKDAKKYTALCVGHAHIDLNWLWRFDETVSIVRDTMTTVLSLMEEYPQFTFAQSQAAIYAIIRDYAPYMLEPIKELVHQGRWELTASTWVEHDNNMISAESTIRQIMYARELLQSLFDIDPDTLDMHFSPDCFGHNANLPKVLRSAGIRSMYFLRGYDEEMLFNWKSNSGDSLLTYREITQYNWSINGSYAMSIPKLCEQYNLPKMLRVFGVGDHGGGPTRRDIEQIIEMDTWPIFCQWKFGTYKEFFAQIDPDDNDLPTVDRELSPVFPGCYTLQSRLKMANRVAETSLYQSELWCALASHSGYSYPKSKLEDAWHKTLFNQFHDILPGCGCVDTREYAMGEFQRVLSHTQNEASHALRHLASRIHTQDLAVDESVAKSTANGAGSGYGQYSFQLPQYSVNDGNRRIFVVFNPCAFERDELVTMTLWDWQGDKDRIQVKDSDGAALDYQILNTGLNTYWGHQYTNVLVHVHVEGMAYKTLVMDEAEGAEVDFAYEQLPKVSRPKEAILENDHIKASLCPKTGVILSLIDKHTGKDYAAFGPYGVFHYVIEQEFPHLSAWEMGEFINVENINRHAMLKEVKTGAGLLRQEVTYAITFGKYRNSKLDVKVYLDRDAKHIAYDVSCRWEEIGNSKDNVPLLQFAMKTSPHSTYHYAMPGGSIQRDEKDMDVASLCWASATDEEGHGVLLSAPNKYGFRSHDDQLAVTLLRSAFEPEQIPEVGQYKFNLTIYPAVDGYLGSQRHIDSLEKRLHVVNTDYHEGCMPKAHRFMSILEGEMVVSSVKLSQDGSSRIIKGWAKPDAEDTICMQFDRKVISSHYCDALERMLDGDIGIDQDTIRFGIEANKMVTIAVKLQDSEVK